MKKVYVYSYNKETIYALTKELVKGLQVKFLKTLTFKQFLEAEKT